MTEQSYDLVVIGGGSGGLEAAYNAAVMHQARVAVVEVQTHHGPPNYSAVGGTCVNVGCVPKKLFVTAAGYQEHFKDAKGFGWSVDPGQMRMNWKTLKAAKDKAVGGINDSYTEMFQHQNLDLVKGWGRIKDKNTVEVRSEQALDSAVTNKLCTKRILVAAGGWPKIPDIVGKEHAITSNEVFYLDEVPARPLIVGGGYIAVEFASIFQSFIPGPESGGEVTLAYRGEMFLRGFDDDIRTSLKEQMTKRGINVQLKENPAKIELIPASGGKKKSYKVTFESGKVAEYGLVMYCTGRAPKTANLGLESVGVALQKNGAVVVDEYSKTSVDNIYAIGDVTDRINLTPVAINEGDAFVETVYAGNPTKPNHENVASAVFSIPQIGTCGLTEEKAKKKYDTVAVYKATSNPLMHKISGNTYKQWVAKILTNHATGKVVGLHLLAAEAGEVIQAIGIVMKIGGTIQDFYSTIGVHPTSAEELCSMKEPAYFYVNGNRVEKLP